MSRALRDIERERARQDLRWGPEHDDRHTQQNWADFLRVRVNRLGRESPALARRDLVEIAAIALAAIQAHDRAN